MAAGTGLTARRAARAVGTAAGTAMAVGQLAMPLVGRPVASTTGVVGGLAAATTAFAAERWGWCRAARAATAVAAGTLTLEWAGHRTGLPFGRYRYTDLLRAQVLGVPVVVPLAWFGMAVPAREVAARLAPPGAARVALGAAALTAWDLALDPQMVDLGVWRWERPSGWRGIPLSNYAGWAGASAAVVAALERLLPEPGAGGSDGLLALYGWMGAVEAAGFLLVFGDPLVGVVTGLVMLPLAALAWRRHPGGRRAGGRRVGERRGDGRHRRG